MEKQVRARLVCMRTTDVSVLYRVKRDLLLVPFLLEEQPGEVVSRLRKHDSGSSVSPDVFVIPAQGARAPSFFSCLSLPTHSALCPCADFPDSAFKPPITRSHTHTPSHAPPLLPSPLWALLFPSLPCAQGHVSSLFGALNMGPLRLGPSFLHSHLFSNPAEFCSQNPASSSPVFCFSELGYHLNALHRFDKRHVSRPSVTYNL